MTDPARLRLTIDRLTLYGVAPGDAAAVQRAMVRAVEARLAQADLAMLSAGEPRLQLSIAAGHGPAALGQAAGQAIGTSLTRGRS